MKHGKLDLIEDSELQKILDTSDSFVDVLKRVGLNPYAGNQRTLKNRIKKSSLDTSKLDKNRTAFYRIPKRSSDMSSILIKNSPYSLVVVKRLILKINLLDYSCQECGIKDTYNGKSLSLQLDHINGEASDHRIENLRWLCPNCHSQTETFAGRNSKKNFNKCLVCYKSIGKNSSYCRNCITASRLSVSTKIDWPETDSLLEDIAQSSFLAVAKKLGVSDNGIRNHLKCRGVDLRKLKPVIECGIRNYWRGCRCDICKAANNEKSRNYKRNRKSRGVV